MRSTILVLWLAVSPAGTFPVGAAVEKVVCRENPQQSYALYLPSAYTAERRWPILFCFDPAWRGMLPLELFRPSAEEHGFIIVSSNSFRSDQKDFSITQEAISAIWNDSLERYSIDPNRLYATGFSGGARISWLMAHSVNAPFAGIIGVGAGLPWPKLPKEWDRSLTSFYGVAGEIDFNHYEMTSLAETLDREGVHNRFDSFPGSHQWPGRELCSKAWEWMEIQAMRQGRRAPDPALIEDFRNGHRQAAREYLESGRLVQAAREYRDLVRSLEGLHPTSEEQESLRRIEAKAELKRQRKSIRKNARQAREAIDRYEDAMATLDTPDLQRAGTTLPRHQDLAFAMRLKPLLDKAHDPKRDPEERRGAQRALETIYVRSSFYRPRDYRQQGDLKKAALCLELAAQIKPDDPAVWYRLGQVWAVSGQSGRALDALERAMSLGLSPAAALLGKQRDFESLRGEPRFQHMLKTASPDGSRRDER